MNLFCLFVLMSLLSLSVYSFAAKVDTLDIPSMVIQKNLRAGVVLPNSYAKGKLNYPILFLLHGGSGKFSDWLLKTPDRMLLQNLADHYNLIIVTPKGQDLSGYIDSPFQKDNQFETYITKEVIDKIDKTYPTIRDRKGRVITGLSMGGHGALYLSARRSDLYCASSSISGAVDLGQAHWKITPDRR